MIVHLPEASLLAGTRGGRRRESRVRMELVNRKIPEYPSDPAGPNKPVHDRWLDRSCELPAKGTFKIRELNHRHRGIG
jgi:hypothetical protein